MLCTLQSARGDTVTDIAGREVTVPSHVQRILLGEGRLFYAVALLEGQQPLARIVGWQGDFRRLDTQTYAAYRAKFPAIDAIPLIGNTTADSISPEKVLTLRPDIAIFGLSGGHGPGKDSELVQQLERAGVPVVFVDFRANPLKNTLPSMRLLGKVLQREAEADKYVRFYQQSLARITDYTGTLTPAQKPSVFIELRAAALPECCGTAGKGNMGDFIDLAGGRNLARDLLPGPLGTVNLEQVLSMDPDVYIASGAKAPQAPGPGVALGAAVNAADAQRSLDTVLARPGIRELRAVRDGNSYAIWHNFYNSPYNILAIQAFARWFHPQAFADLDINETQARLYREFLAIPPSGTWWIAAAQPKQETL
nr:ABC transporter substrate-binding protein [Pantoea sp. 1.19]